MKKLIPILNIESRVLFIPGHRVILDTDLAALYGVSTKRLNEQVKRNTQRFPGDFMYRLSEEEKAEVVANCDHLHRLRFSSTLPYAFTEHGAVMLASVLNSSRAIAMSLLVVRTFVRLRELLGMSRHLADRHAEDIRAIVATIRQLMTRPTKRTPRIGFKA